MTLNDILSALANNEMLNITVVTPQEETETELISFEIAGYELLSSTLLERTVSEVRIGSSLTLLKEITIKVI